MQWQACIGAKVIASESLSAIRKDVLSKCYGVYNKTYKHSEYVEVKIAISLFLKFLYNLILGEKNDILWQVLM